MDPVFKFEVEKIGFLMLQGNFSSFELFFVSFGLPLAFFTRNPHLKPE
jgi:hypothetical protein